MSAGQGYGRVLLRWLPALAWMGLIFVLSSQSGLAVSEDVAVERPLRGVAHLVSFGILAGLLLVAISGIRRPAWRPWSLAFAVTALYGVSDEWHQSMVPTRSARVEDLAIDVIGALIGLGIAWLLLGWLSRRRGPARGGAADRRQLTRGDLTRRRRPRNDLEAGRRRATPRALGPSADLLDRLQGRSPRLHAERDDVQPGRRRGGDIDDAAPVDDDVAGHGRGPGPPSRACRARATRWRRRRHRHPARRRPRCRPPRWRGAGPAPEPASRRSSATPGSSASGSQAATDAPRASSARASRRAGNSRRSSVPALKVRPRRATRRPARLAPRTRSRPSTSHSAWPRFEGQMASMSGVCTPWARASRGRARACDGKHEPPKPGPGERKPRPMRRSRPMPSTTACASAPVAAARRAISLAKVILAARKTLEATLMVSALVRSVTTTGASSGP